MNILIKNKKINYYESIWRKAYKKKKYDITNKPFPFPIRNSKKLSKKYLIFIIKLKKIQKILYNNKEFTKYKKFKNCLITKKKNIGTMLFHFLNVNWDDTLIYYMKKFNILPSKEFYNFIINIKIKNNKIILNPKFKFKYFLFNSNLYEKSKSKYLFFSQNLLRILDSLYIDGSKPIYKNKKKYIYSEHSGLIDFNINNIEKIIINAKKNYIDKNDDTIFLPLNIDNEADYEFIFHTHPKTKNRINDGIIYEFPSINDIINFYQNNKEGYTQGSLIVAPEGMYIIEILDPDFSIKNINLNDEYNLENNLYNIHELSIKKYGKKFSKSEYYNKIIKDKTFIKIYNKKLNNFNLNIKLIPREKKNNSYIIPNFYLKFNIIEKKYI